ncbi:MAG: alpha-L-fucosidase [Verrucomicrobiae bacterium]|nr:alpha-L-fucosidase [Verrucomicrobiae bacterium]
MKRLNALFSAALLLCVTGWAQTNRTPTFDAIYQRKIPAWFNEAKFGVFIVWGVYSVPGWAQKGQYAEWYGHNILDQGSPSQQYHERVWGKHFTYDQFVPLLSGEGFDANEWTSLIQKAGAKYVVTAANYHDGFAMYPTRYAVSKFGDRWNAFDRGPHRDVLGELEACGNAKGLKMGIYYSLYEWWNPLYMSGQLEEYARDHLGPKFKEVVSRYHPPVIFLDGEWEHPYQTWHSDELANWLYTESPVKDEVVVNDRWGLVRGKYGDYFSSEYGGGDYPPTHPWQEDRGIGNSYGYNRNEDAWDYNTRQTLVRLLSTVCGNGGNLLLDIGPTADGRIPPIMEERLLEIGDWLSKNGAAIYGSGASPFWPRKFEWGVCTAKGDTVFLHLFDQSIKSLDIKGFSAEVEGCKYLATGVDLKFAARKNELLLDLTPVKPDSDDTVIAVKIHNDLKADKRPHQYESGKILISAWSLTINGSKAKMRFDGFEKIAHITDWTDPSETASCRFVVDQPGRYQVSVTYCSDKNSAGSAVVLNFNNQKINFVSGDTGGWSGGNYRNTNCGTISLSQVGEQQLSIVPVANGWKNVAIKQILLTPEKRRS